MNCLPSFNFATIQLPFYAGKEISLPANLLQWASSLFSCSLTSQNPNYIILHGAVNLRVPPRVTTGSYLNVGIPLSKRLTTLELGRAFVKLQLPITNNPN